MKKKNVIILSGISGSGKSTWLNENQENYKNSIVLSTDGIREKENLEFDSLDVFPILYDQYTKALNDSKIDTIFIDSTALSRRRRLAFQSKKAKITIVLFFVSFETATKRILEREVNFVPESQLKLQLKAFTPPIIGIDCDEFIMTGESFFDRKKFYSLIDKRNYRVSLALIKDVHRLIDVMIPEVQNFEMNGIERNHRSSYHLEDIDTHINLTISNSNSTEMKIIGLFHDLGKPLCRQDGEVFSSFKGHEKYSSLVYLNFLYSIDKNFREMIKSNDETLLIIFYHMILFNNFGNKGAKKIGLTEKMLDLLIEFNNIDKKSSITKKEDLP